jgi:predicted transcriptional regulator
MLQIRTNILLDEKTHQKLKKLAKETNKSMGKLIREAVDGFYMEDEAKRRQLIKEQIKKYRVHLKGKVNYKELIEHGRKH